MATQPTRRRGPAEPKARTHVMASVKLDVATYARLSAAAALAGIDKSTYMSRAITESLQGVVVFDRRSERAPKLADRGDPSSEGRSEDAA